MRLHTKDIVVMRLAEQQRLHLERASMKINLCCDTFMQLVKEKQWPLAADLSSNLKEGVDLLGTAVADVLGHPADAEIDGNSLAQAVSSLRRVVPEAKRANQIAAGDYMNQWGEQSAGDADRLEHMIAKPITEMSNVLYWIEKHILSKPGVGLNGIG
jgi:hypothetical protein